MRNQLRLSWQDEDEEEEREAQLLSLITSLFSLLQLKVLDLPHGALTLAILTLAATLTLAVLTLAGLTLATQTLTSLTLLPQMSVLGHHKRSKATLATRLVFLEHSLARAQLTGRHHLYITRTVVWTPSPRCAPPLPPGLPLPCGLPSLPGEELGEPGQGGLLQGAGGCTALHGLRKNQPRPQNNVLYLVMDWA